VLEERPAMDWFEVISENFMVAGGRPLEVLESVREDYPIVLHGVSMSLGSTDALNREYLNDLARLAHRFEPAWISDHLCWTGVGGHNLHDLLPLPYTKDALRHVVLRIREVQEILQRPILIENVSSYLEFTISSLSEWAFLAAVAEEEDRGILLDINNIYVSAFNFDSIRWFTSTQSPRNGLSSSTSPVTATTARTCSSSRPQQATRVPSIRQCTKIPMTDLATRRGGGALSVARSFIYCGSSSFSRFPQGSR
jgi:hypothetical protein